MLSPPYIWHSITGIREGESVPFQDKADRLVRMDRRYGTYLHTIFIVDDVIDLLPVEFVDLKLQAA